MGLTKTALKWKLGLGKKELPCLLFLLNGKTTFFGATVDEIGCIKVKNSNGKTRRVILTGLRESVDNEIVKQVCDWERVNLLQERIRQRENVGADASEELVKLEAELGKEFDCIAAPTNALLKNKQKLVVLVEGKAGNIHPMDLVKETKPNLEDVEINNALESAVDLGRELERRQKSGMPFGEKASLALTLVLLLAVGVLIWLTLTNNQLLMQFLEKGVKVAGSTIKPAIGG